MLGDAASTVAYALQHCSAKLCHGFACACMLRRGRFPLTAPGVSVREMKTAGNATGFGLDQHHAVIDKRTGDIVLNGGQDAILDQKTFHLKPFFLSHLTPSSNTENNS